MTAFVHVRRADGRSLGSSKDPLRVEVYFNGRFHMATHINLDHRLSPWQLSGAAERAAVKVASQEVAILSGVDVSELGSASTKEHSTGAWWVTFKGVK